MECKTFTADSFETVITSDWHIGARNVDKKALAKMIDYIKKTGCNWTHNGDLCESTPHTQKNYDHRTTDPEIQGIGQEYAYVKKLIRPIAAQCAGIITGNHDERNAKNAEIDMVEQICDDLEIPYLRNAAYNRLCYTAYGKKCSTLMYQVHGFSSGRQRGSRLNSLENISISHYADLYVSGHTHDLFVSSAVRDTMTSNGNYENKYVYFGNSGTFLRSYIEGQTSYAESAGYHPNKVGYLKATFNPVDRSIKMEEVVL